MFALVSSSSKPSYYPGLVHPSTAIFSNLLLILFNFSLSKSLQRLKDQYSGPKHLKDQNEEGSSLSRAYICIFLK